MSKNRRRPPEIGSESFSGGITHAAAPEEWYKAIVEESGDFYKWIDIPGAPPPPTH